MRYGSTILIGLATTLLLTTSTKPVQACGYGMPSPAARFVLADTVLVGKVIAFEAKPLKLRFGRQGQPFPHVVAVIKVNSMLLGDERVTHVRVALAQHQAMQPGYEGLFFFRQHPDDFVLVPSSGEFDYPIAKQNNPGFENQVETYRRMARLLRNPEAGLTSKDANERFLTAALLVSKYRSQRIDYTAPTMKTEDIDSRQSRLILKVLAETDWTTRAADFRLTPRNVFTMLGVTPADGLNLSNMQNWPQREEAMRQWLKEKQDTFRIKAFVRL